ncbi:hypothetical protein PT276_02450 [Orbaceae bacterium ESL0721]|nr:hypothetical protein [Orbaceae bacterium ESL0721]
MPSTKHQAPSTKHQAPSTKHQAPSTKHQAPSTKHQAPLKKLTVFAQLFSFPQLTIFLLFSTVSPLTSYAALSATTKSTIIGSRPYFTFDGGKTKVDSVEALLGITLTDGTSYSKSDNPSTPEKPIELSDTGLSFEDITTAIPKTLSQINLNDLVHAPYNNWGDDDGDGQGDSGITATGIITMTITNVRGEVVDRSEVLSACSAPYKVNLTTSAGLLTTQFGDPNNLSFGAEDVTYYFKPKHSDPFPCWAQPNIAFSKGHIPNGYPQDWGEGFDGPITEWLPHRGFLPHNNPASNFPTTGAHGLFFNFTVGDALGRNVTYSKTPASSGIDLQITDGGNNVARVMLTGPRHNDTPAKAATAVPTTFTLYANGSTVYSFTISKWFISNPISSEYLPNYCLDHYGANYRYPHITDLTNANDPAHNWSGGLANQQNWYQRRIGGGLFAEWGNMSASVDENRYYKSSDFAWRRYWTDQPFGSNRINIGSDHGYIYDEPEYYIQADVVCVTP